MAHPLHILLACVLTVFHRKGGSHTMQAQYDAVTDQGYQASTTLHQGDDIFLQCVAASYNKRVCLLGYQSLSLMTVM